MARMPWFRVYSEILDDKKIKRICRLTSESKALVIGIWISLLSLANDSGEWGRLTISDDIPYTMDDLIEETGCDEDLLNTIIDQFIEMGMIEIAGTTYEIKNWNGRQFKSDDSSQRVREWRAKQDETLQKRSKSVIDTESDTESDTDKNRLELEPSKTDNLFDACMNIYQTKKGLPVTDGASFSLMITNFKKQGVTAEDYAAAIDAMDADDNYKGTKPTSYEKWTIGLADKRKHPAKVNRKKTNEEIVKEMIESGEI